MVSEKQVLDALRGVLDPEIGLSVVELGLIYGVHVEKGKIKIRMTLTSPACPLASLIVQRVREKAESVAGVKSAEVELVFNPPWTPERLSAEAKKKLGFTKPSE
jgi:metal-sulfur cluster biosynthetic enzyme